MRERVSGTWVLFFIFVFGLLVMMVGVRPELQPNPNQPVAPGPTIEVIGQLISGAAGTALGVRLVVSTRSMQRASSQEASRNPPQP